MKAKSCKQAGLAILIQFCAASCFAQNSDPITCQNQQAEGDHPSTSLANPPRFDWQGEFLETPICIQNEYDEQWQGFLLRPAKLTGNALIPGIVISPGSGAPQEHLYRWAGRQLAGHGYFALIIEPQQQTDDPEVCQAAECVNVPQQNTSTYLEALGVAINYLRERRHPWLAQLNIELIGLAGHSLSARTVSYIQGENPWVDAIVAWDNLSSDLHGDAGSPSGGGTIGSTIGGQPTGPQQPVHPRVPAMGHASDTRNSTQAGDDNPNIKKTAYEVWRRQGLASMQLVFRDMDHLAWTQDGSESADDASARLELLAWYTRAWFDHHLKGDEASKILPREIADQTPEQWLSTKFNSAVYLPEQSWDCPELQKQCMGNVIDPVDSRQVEPVSSGGSGGFGVLGGLLVLLGYRRHRSCSKVQPNSFAG